MQSELRPTVFLRGCDFFCAIEFVCGYKECMSYLGAGEAAGEVRLRKPERRQMEWGPQCTDDLVAAAHGGRTGAAGGGKMDLSGVWGAGKTRERGAGGAGSGARGGGGVWGCGACRRDG